MNDVHCWCVSLDVSLDTLAGLDATLSGDERDRRARFRFARDRRRFVVARGVLRDLLGHYLGTPPDQVRFVCNPFGKPELDPEFGSRVTFNLSHSGDLALIAVTTDAAIGVDIEYVQEHPEYGDVAERFLSAADVDYLNGLWGHRRAHAFFSCWTKKEALVKARGEGLSVDGDGAPTDAVPPQGWSFYTLQPAPGYVGAVAVEGEHRRLRQWTWRSTESSGASLSLGPAATVAQW